MPLYWWKVRLEEPQMCSQGHPSWRVRPRLDPGLSSQILIIHRMLVVGACDLDNTCGSGQMSGLWTTALGTGGQEPWSTSLLRCITFAYTWICKPSRRLSQLTASWVPPCITAFSKLHGWNCATLSHLLKSWTWRVFFFFPLYKRYRIKMTGLWEILCAVSQCLLYACQFSRENENMHVIVPTGFGPVNMDD